MGEAQRGTRVCVWALTSLRGQLDAGRSATLQIHIEKYMYRSGGQGPHGQDS